MLDIKKAVRAAIESDKARITLCSSASIAALYALTSISPVFAADAAGASAKGSDSLEEIVVSGYRKSLQSARDIKRDSAVMVDSISATDIGALPDRSVTEAMSRIPGVSINRFAAGNDPDHFSVEGSGVTIRGLSYTSSEFNGRDTFSANNGRALSFADVPSELLGGVDVFKSPSADMIEGGIGGIVNLRTRLPFDSKGQKIAGSLDVNYTDFDKKTTPNASLLYSNRWDTSAGEFGVLASGSYSDLKDRSDKIQVSNFYEYGLTNPVNGGYATNTAISQSPTPPPPDSQDIYTQTGANQIAYLPRGAVEGTELFDHSRQGYSLALQWTSPDKSWAATVQALRSDSRETTDENTIEIATDNVSNPGNSGYPNSVSDIRSAYGTQFMVGPSGLMSSGTITASSGWSQDWNNTLPGPNGTTIPAGRVPANGLQTNNYTRDADQHFLTDDYSAHLTWTPSENAKLEFDAQHVKSSVNDLDVEMDLSTYEDLNIQLTGANGLGLPSFTALPPTNCAPAAGNVLLSPAACAASGGLGTATHSLFLSAPHNSYADPYNYFPRAAMDHIERSNGIENAFRLDGTFALDDNSWIKSFKVGVRYSDRNQTARYTTYNWGVLSEAWGGTGPIWLDQAPSSNMPIVDDTYQNYFRGQISSPVGPQGRLFYGGNTAQNYVQMINYANAVSYAWTGSTPTVVNGVNYSGGWNPLWGRQGVVPGTPFLPQEINPVIEKNEAAYFMTNFAHDVSNGWKLTGNAGVRVTSTDRTAIGSSAVNAASFTSPTDCASDIAGAQLTGTPAPAYCLLTNAQQTQLQTYFQQTNLPSTVDLKYGYVLPSFNLKLDVGGGMQWRLDYFKGIFNPDFGYTRNDFTVSWDSLGTNFSNTMGGTATAGNPYLRPTKSDNVDLSFEYYFSDVGQFSIAAFYKELKDIVVNGNFNTNVSRNGVSLPVLVTSATNSPDLGLVKGFEVGYQQQYDFLPGWLSGFGLNANYTYTSSNGVRQGTLSDTATNVQNTSEQNRPFLTVDIGLLPLQGLSKNTINITPFYSKGPWDIRLAYSWRSEFLLTTQDVIVPYQPIMNLATGQLDGSIFYTINSNFKIGLQASNLTDEVTKTAAVINNYLLLAPRSYFINDRRFALGVRVNFE